MKPDMTLAELLNETESIARDAQSTFGELNAEQINWKPADNKWSVAQCLEHLIVTNGQMLSVFDRVASGTRQTKLIERLPILPSLWGRMMVKALTPDSKQKFKAPPTASPSSSSIDPQIVTQFAANQQEVAGKIKAVENLNPEKIIITSPFAGFITYSLLDAARIIIVHERRHLAQAERVMATDGFPK
ncbi:MAG: DinB family protein [Blastocatellales bacterium]